LSNIKGFLIKGKSENIGTLIVNHFKANLNECIEKNGTTSLIVLNKSQELDNLIVREQIKLLNLKGC